MGVIHALYPAELIAHPRNRLPRAAGLSIPLPAVSAVSSVRPGWYAPGVKIAGKDIPPPAVLIAVAVVLLAGGVAAEWAVGPGSVAPVQRQIERISRLEREARAGLDGPAVGELLDLARDRTVVPLEGRPPIPMHLIPHDTVGDLALDALRRIRTGNPEAPRVFEWNSASGAGYEEAVEAWRQAELAEALEWWRAARVQAAP